MIYGSVCSGIEAATVAWHPLGWKPAFFSEIEKFPRQVLAHHYPHVPLHGDFTTIKGDEYEPIKLLVGGTPCQSFSVAGLRKGLDDPRGNLMLEFGALARRLGPKWLVWENVPGVLSSNGGRDFGTFLGMLAELGYGFAYRVLDAQYFGVPQRRRRVFVVGCLGDWRSAAAVLFERHSLSGNPAPSRKKGQEVTEIAGTLAANGGGLNRPAGNANELDFCVATTAKCLTAKSNMRLDFETEDFVTYGIAGNIIGRKPKNGGNGLGADDSGAMYTLTKTDIHAVAFGIPDTTHTLRGEGFDASEDGTGRGTPLVQVGIFQDSEFGVAQYDSAGTLRAGRIPEHQMVMHPVAFHPTQDPISSTDGSTHAIGCGSTGGQASVAVACFKGGQGSAAGGIGYDEHVAPTLSAADSGSNRTPTLMQNMQVRRLTATECERLQGFPDGYTAIPWRNKPASECPDGPRYKALGNSMAVPVMRWIGERIQTIEDLKK